MANRLTEEQKRKLKEAYLEDNYLSLKQLSDISESVCGIKVETNNLKQMSMIDGWAIEKRRQQLGKSGQPKDIADEADDLRKIVYDMIMDPEVQRDPAAISQLIGTWDKIRIASPRKSSGKSSRQQQIEATQAGIEKAAERILARRKAMEEIVEDVSE